MGRTQKAPGKAHRTGLPLDQLYVKFSTESVARTWFEQVRWPNGRACPRCGNMETTEAKNGGTMPYHCNGFFMAAPYWEACTSVSSPVV